MITFVVTLILIGIICWGFYLYYKIGQLDRRIAKFHSAHLEGENDR